MDRKSIRDAVEILPLLILMKFTKLLPLKVKIVLGGLFFSWLVTINRRLRNRISNNLDLTMPEITKTQKRAFIKKFGTLAGKTFTELIFNAEFQKSSSKFKYTKDELSPLLTAKNEGRPIIIVSAHFGPWEAVRAVLKRYNLTAGAIYKKNNNQFYEPLHLKAIKHGGEPIFATGSNGTRKMIQHLKGGGIVAAMLDQAAKDGEFFDFLGVPAKTSTSVAKLALRLNALLVPAYAIRNPKSDQISVFFEPPIEHTNYKDMTSRLTASIEARVLLNPHQWYWLHKRWKY